MSRLVQRVALSAVLVHMSCGCCLHHAHGETVRYGEGPAAITCFLYGHCGDCVHQGSQKGESSHHGCGEPNCVFVRPERKVALKLEVPRSPDALASPISAAPSGSSTTRVIDISGSRAGHWGLPVRLHLLNQVLLI